MRLALSSDINKLPSFIINGAAGLPETFSFFNQPEIKSSFLDTFPSSSRTILIIL